MFAVIRKSVFLKFILLLYIVIFLWWIRLQITYKINTEEAFLFDWSYGFINLSGGLYGIFSVAKRWGGFKSTIGKGLIFIGYGLLSQWIGLQIWTYYNLILKVQVPYPSWADAGYFGLVPFYTIGALMIAKAAGGRFGLRTTWGRTFAVIIPFAMLSVAYFLFVKAIGFNLENPIKIFFDFGYPLGEILPASIAMFTLSLSRGFLGGKMKNRILYLVFAFIFQFFTEYIFLYMSGAGIYVNGGVNDLLYATSYVIMTIGLISFKEF